MNGTAVLRALLLMIEVVSAFLLIVIILMQKSKSQGVGMAFGNAMGESLFGAQMGNVLTKATVVLAVIFLVNTTFLAMLGTGGGARSIADTIPEVPVQAPAQPGLPALPAETVPALPAE